MTAPQPPRWQRQDHTAGRTRPSRRQSPASTPQEHPAIVQKHSSPAQEGRGTVQEQPGTVQKHRDVPPIRHRPTTRDPHFLDDKPQLVNPAFPPEPAPMGRVDAPDDVIENVDLERYGVAARGWKPFWDWFVGIFKHDPAWWRRQVAFLIVLALLIVSAAFVLADHWRRGVTVLAGTALLTAAFRSFLPADYVEMLEVRSQRFDVIFLLVVGTALLFLVMTVPS